MKSRKSRRREVRTPVWRLCGPRRLILDGRWVSNSAPSSLAAGEKETQSFQEFHFGKRGSMSVPWGKQSFPQDLAKDEIDHHGVGGGRALHDVRGHDLDVPKAKRTVTSLSPHHFPEYSPDVLGAMLYLQASLSNNQSVLRRLTDDTTFPSMTPKFIVSQSLDRSRPHLIHPEMSLFHLLNTSRQNLTVWPLPTTSAVTTPCEPLIAVTCNMQ